MLKEKLPLERVYELVKRLRAPDGCPWDRKQTNYTIRYDLVEEAYEVIEAIEAGNDMALREELGDLLFLVLMHIRIGEEEGRFKLEDVTEGIINKMISRHPHVFGDVKFEGQDELLDYWEKSKKNAFAGLALSMPSLLLAQKVLSREKRLKIKREMPRIDLSDLEDADAEKLSQLLIKIASIAEEKGINLEAAFKNFLKKEIAKLRDVNEP